MCSSVLFLFEGAVRRPFAASEPVAAAARLCFGAGARVAYAEGGAPEVLTAPIQNGRTPAERELFDLRAGHLAFPRKAAAARGGFMSFVPDGEESGGRLAFLNGLPLIAAAEGGKGYLSCAHGGSFAAALFSDAPCGVDLEPVGRIRPRVLARYLAAERQAVSKGGARAFYQIWCAKEAAAKAEGRSAFYALAAVDTAAKAGSFRFFEPAAGYILAICGAHTERIKFFKILLDKK